MSVSRYSGAASEIDRTQEWQDFTRNLGAREVGRAGYSILIFEISQASFTDAASPASSPPPLSPRSSRSPSAIC